MVSSLTSVGVQGKLSAWPYVPPDNDTVTHDDLLAIKHLTGSSLADIYEGLGQLRNGYNLGLVELRNDSYRTPEAALVKTFLAKVEAGIYSKEDVIKFFDKVGGVKGFVEGIVSAVRSSKSKKFKL